jgi:hypothetical protein
MKSIFPNSTTDSTDADVIESPERRDFLDRCGKFAVVTPPAITLLLSTTLSSEAIAASGGTTVRPKPKRPPKPPKPPKRW